MVEYKASTALLPRIGRYVIILTAKTEEMDKVAGLSVGVEDYITQPFSPRELAARVKAALRRIEAGTGSVVERSVLSFGSGRPEDVN